MRTRGIAVRWGTTVVASALLATLVVLAPARDHVGPLVRSAGTTYLCSGYAACNKAGYSDAGYGAVNGKMYWNMYAGHNCTNYIAFRMIKAGMSATRPWVGNGNASEWGKHMASITDQVPNVGAVAWWGRYSNGSGSAGHVAYVEKVVSATEIVVSEDSWGGTFHWRTITKSSGRWPTGFIHFVDKRIGGTARPVVTGTPRVGVQLKASAGSWSGGPTKYAYQWLADGAAIGGATAATYTPAAATVGKRLSVRVTASKSGSTSATQDSATTGAVAEGVFSLTRAPSVTGTFLIDDVLVADKGAWAPAPGTTVWRWFADGVRVPDNTTARLPLTTALVGKKISLKIVAKQTGYANLVSPAYDLGTVLAGVLEMPTPAVVEGEPGLGKVLTVKPGVVTPSGAAVTYQWLRDGVPIAGATSTTYRIAAADVGTRMSVQVNAVRNQYLPFTTVLAATPRVTSPAAIKLVTKPKQGRAVARVKVTAAGKAPVKGKVLIKIGRWSRTVRLVDGVAKVVVALPPGAKAVRVRYLGSPVVPPARTSGTVRVR